MPSPRSCREIVSYARGTAEPMTYSFNPELRARIQKHLAAHEVQRLHAPEARHAAVGVVLLPNEAGEACFVLTRRVATLRRHGGQWALPGGRLEPGESPQEAALREIHEEVGLALDASAVIGSLDDFLTRSGHLISLMVMWSSTSAITVNAEEVHAGYVVPLQHLDAPDAV